MVWQARKAVIKGDFLLGKKGYQLAYFVFSVGHWIYTKTNRFLI